MIKNTLEIPPGCFYTQLKVFIGVKSTMNCNPSCPAATLLASLDRAYLYWPPPPHRLLACFMSPRSFPLLYSNFDEPVNEVCLVLFSYTDSPVSVMLCFTLSDVVPAQSLTALSSQDCQQQKPNDWKFWPQNCYWAKLVQDWLIQIRISSKIWSFFHNEERFEPCFALDIWISHQIDERKWKRLRCARYSFGELSNIGSHIVHWTDEEIFHLMPAKNISWCKRKYLKVLLLEKNDAGFDWSNQQKRDCRLVIAKIFANYFVQFYLFYYWGPSWLDNTDLTHLHFFLVNQ